MKVVWLLNHYAQEPGGPGGTRHYSLARHLADYGWDAYLIASSVEHGTGRQRLSEGEKRRAETIGGVRFLWLKCHGYANNGLDRVRNMLDYTARALGLRAGVDGLPKPDIVIGSSVHPLAAWAGLRLARRNRVPFVFEVRDLWPQTLIDLGRLSPRHPATIVLSALENYLYRQATLVITLLPYSIDYIACRGVARSRILWLPNGAETGPEPRPDTGNRTFTFMYFGAHGLANELNNILKAIEILKTRGLEDAFRFRFIGDGPEKPALQSLASANNLGNVTFEPPVPKSAVPALAAEADAFVFNLGDTSVFKYGISSNKLFDYMAAGRPIIFACGAPNNPIADAGSGLTVPPENPSALADTMVDMANRPLEERQAMGQKGRAYLKANHDLHGLAGKLAEALDQIS